MDTTLLKSTLIWGFILWLVGYLLGILLFPFVPVSAIGWIITPIGILLTLWVLFKKIHAKRLNEYIMIGLIWTVIAIVLDYFLLVQLFKPEDGYYKLDVYIYYGVTFFLPLLVGSRKVQNSK